MRLALPCLAAALIAGATAVCAQTLPFYDVAGTLAACLARVERWSEKDQIKTAAQNLCRAVYRSELSIRDHLAKEWNSFDPSKRLSCTSDKKNTKYYDLEECLEDPHYMRPPKKP